MCDPATIALTMTISSTIFTGIQQYQQAATQADIAKKQTEYNQRNWKLQAEANAAAAQRQIDQLNIKQGQQRTKAAQEKVEAVREARAREARILAEGESALNTGTMKALLGEAGIQFSEEMETIKANEAAAIQQTQYEKKEARERGKTVGEAPTAYIAEPNLGSAILGTTLGIGSVVAGHYAPKKK